MRYKNLPKCLSFLAIGILIILILAYNLQTPKSKTKSVFALNTYVTVTVYGQDAQNLCTQAINLVTEAEKTFSAYHKDSELYKLNTLHQKDVPYPVSDELFFVLDEALKVCKQTQGKFDITIKPLSDLWSITENPHLPSPIEIENTLPRVDYRAVTLDAATKTVTMHKDGMALDLGGIAKGYIADKLTKALSDAYGATIDLGGNIVVLGKHKDGWKIGVQTPFADAGMYTAIVKAPSGEATTVVTSGAYERNFVHDGKLYHHIFNPSTGYPAESETESISVIGKTSLTADAFSTYLFMLAPEDAITFAKTNGFDVLIQTKDKKIYTTLTEYNIIDNAYNVQ